MIKLTDILREVKISNLPVINKDTVYHVGTMDISKKSEYSYEGSGLSVSEHPDEWKRIARLNSTEVHTLTKSGSKFLDFYGLSDEQKKVITSWGVENGYVKDSTVYVISWYDDEMEDTMEMEFDNREDAEYEAADYDSEVEERGGLTPTSKLKSKTRQSKIAPSQTFELLTTVYTEDETNFDGVWWDEELDVSRYSAPRGVIFNDMIKTWKEV